MARRLFVLFVPLLLVVAACSDDDPKASSEKTTTTSTTETTLTPGDGDGSTSSTSSAPTSTTTPSGDGIAMTGAAGSGRVAYTLDQSRSELCYRISVQGIGEATEAHLHRTDGDDVVLPLQPPAADGIVNTCAASDALTLEEIDADPGDFYIDVHGAQGVLKATLQ